MISYEGYAPVREDRLLVFSEEEVQHRFRHFFTQNSCEKAIYKCLLFHVVEPGYDMPTTSQVEIQRKDFIVSKCLCLARLLPFHIILYIVQYFPYMSPANAIHIAKEMRKEQEDFIGLNSVSLDGGCYSGL